MVCDANDQLVAIATSRPDPEEAEANGRLIEAAPDMYDLLNEIWGEATTAATCLIPLELLKRMSNVLDKVDAG
jgi:hypothetical protein